MKCPDVVPILLIILCVNCNLLIAQETPEEVDKYIDLLTSFSYESTDELMADLDTMSIQRLKLQAKIMYESSEQDAILTRQTVRDKCIERDSLADLKYGQNKMVNIFGHPIRTHIELLKMIYNKISPLTFFLVAADYLIKAKINVIESRPYYLIDHPTYRTTLTYINVTITEIFKGKSRFRLNDTIEFLYVPQDRGNYDFMIGETCLIPLSVAGNDQESISLDTRLKYVPLELIDLPPGGSYGRFPIENGLLIDKDNTIGLGEKMDWIEFRAKLIDQINTIKSW